VRTHVASAVHAKDVFETVPTSPAASPRLRRRLSPWPPDRRHEPAQELPDPPEDARVRTAIQP
jgi:hypothetical protein